MDDISLIAEIDDDTIVYVSPMHDHTYSEFIEGATLGGPKGYFIARQYHGEFEILAKAANLDAARAIFGMLTQSTRSARHVA